MSAKKRSVQSYVCWVPSEGGTRENGYEYDALGHSEAAELFAHEWWADSGSTEDCEVRVWVARVGGSDVVARVFDVEIECEPTFLSNEVDLAVALADESAEASK